MNGHGAKHVMVSSRAFISCVRYKCGIAQSYQFETHMRTNVGIGCCSTNKSGKHACAHAYACNFLPCTLHATASHAHRLCRISVQFPKGLLSRTDFCQTSPKSSQKLLQTRYSSSSNPATGISQAGYPCRECCTRLLQQPANKYTSGLGCYAHGGENHVLGY